MNHPSSTAFPVSTLSGLASISFHLFAQLQTLKHGWKEKAGRLTYLIYPTLAHPFFPSRSTRITAAAFKPVPPNCIPQCSHTHSSSPAVGSTECKKQHYVLLPSLPYSCRSLQPNHLPTACKATPLNQCLDKTAAFARSSAFPLT